MNALFAARLNHHPWHITPSAAQELRVLAETQITLDDFISPRSPMRAYGGVAFINVCGVLAGGMPGIWEKLGNTDYRTLASEVSAAKADTSVRAAVLYVRSPGGNCVGCTEIYDLVSDLAATKPVIAYTDAMMCSAAYYIASAASFIYASKTAAVGSIGTIYTLCDASEALKAMGVRVFQIASGDLKGGSAEAGYTPAQIADLERVIADYFEAFSSDVRKKRTISDDAMRGQWFKADKAPTGLVDFIGLPTMAAGDALRLAGGDGSLMAPDVVGQFFGIAAPSAAHGGGNKNHGNGGQFSSGAGGGKSYRDDTNSVGSHIHVQAKGDTGDKIHVGLEAIHTVHTDGNLEHDASADNQVEKGSGEYDPRVRSKPRLGVKDSGKHKAFTAVHEVGHYIDDHGLDGGGQDFSSNQDHTDRIAGLKASFATQEIDGKTVSPQARQHLATLEAVQGLKDALGKTKEVAALKNLKVTGPLSATVKDAQQDHQIFARAYSQHIATQSQHPELLRGLKADRDSQFGKFAHLHWSDESFKPVGQKFETLFKAKGWQKGQ